MTSRSASAGIFQAVSTGFVRNVSVMGNCKYLDKAVLKKMLCELSDGVYVYVFHPCKMSDESLLMGYDTEDGSVNAANRNTEMLFCSDPHTLALVREHRMQTIRYDEA
jgi:predicted glycoside hydrolase/deacetylase ChbG (UPF0249 family)